MRSQNGANINSTDARDSLCPGKVRLKKFPLDLDTALPHPLKDPFLGQSPLIPVVHFTKVLPMLLYCAANIKQFAVCKQSFLSLSKRTVRFFFCFFYRTTSRHIHFIKRTQTHGYQLFIVRARRHTE